EGLDPRAELVARLLEYQRFKEVAGEIGERSLLGRDVFSAVAHGLDAQPEAEREIEVGIFELVDAMRRALARGARGGDRDDHRARADARGDAVALRARGVRVRGTARVRRRNHARADRG